MSAYIRSHFGAKLFLSYLVVGIVGTLVLVTTAELAVPSAFERHLEAMRSMMGPAMGTFSTDLESDLFQSFRETVTQAIFVATIAAALVAITTSWLISRQVVAPLRQMQAASQRIAEGQYGERVRVRGDVRRDVLDELGQLAIGFNRMAARLEQTENIRRQLIGDVSHELRTPLTTIKGSMEGLIDGVLPVNEETFQDIYREADRLQRLVNDLQELSRVEAGAFELHLQDVPVTRLIATVAARLELQFTEKSVALITVLPPDLPPVLADEDRIGQVLLNLVGNALQYTPPGGQVRIEAQSLGTEVEITVQDTGIGIAAEHISHLFTRFYRADKSRSRAGGGSGIGLTIARHLVEAHGGRIWAASPGQGKGSTFGFRLPAEG